MACLKIMFPSLVLPCCPLPLLCPLDGPDERVYVGHPLRHRHQGRVVGERPPVEELERALQQATVGGGGGVRRQRQGKLGLDVLGGRTMGSTSKTVRECMQVLLHFLQCETQILRIQDFERY